VKLIKYILLTVFFTTSLSNGALAKPKEQVSWQEQYAYSVGMAAYPYTLPYLYMSQLRWMWTNLERDPERFPYAPINHFYHASKLTDASYRDGGGPNNDTLYSVAWIKVEDQPIILSHPDMSVQTHC